eukprot:1561677-Amphidinium_carterae.1
MASTSHTTSTWTVVSNQGSILHCLRRCSLEKWMKSVNKLTSHDSFDHHLKEGTGGTQAHTYALQVMLPNLREGQRTTSTPSTRRSHRTISDTVGLYYAYTRSNTPTAKKWQVHTVLTCSETMTRLRMAIPTARKGATRHQLTQLKKFVMENGFGHSTIQVDNEPAIIQIGRSCSPRAWSTVETFHNTHTHQGQGAVEHLHQTLFEQVRSIKFDLVD